MADDHEKTASSRSTSMCSVVVYDSPMGSSGQMPRVELVYED
ncbi:hypothetical protein [Mycobacterium sp.]|nr:hypothetical protein [Mycobacterium sp.]